MIDEPCKVILFRKLELYIGSPPCCYQLIIKPEWCLLQFSSLIFFLSKSYALYLVLWKLHTASVSKFSSYSDEIKVFTISMSFHIIEFRIWSCELWLMVFLFTNELIYWKILNVAQSESTQRNIASLHIIQCFELFFNNNNSKSIFWQYSWIS